MHDRAWLVGRDEVGSDPRYRQAATDPMVLNRHLVLADDVASNDRPIVEPYATQVEGGHRASAWLIVEDRPNRVREGDRVARRNKRGTVGPSHVPVPRDITADDGFARGHGLKQH